MLKYNDVDDMSFHISDTSLRISYSLGVSTQTVTPRPVTEGNYEWDPCTSLQDGGK